MILALALFVGFGPSAEAPADVSQIMSRVAANQQTARDTRKAYVYRQEQLLRLNRGSGRLAREERLEYVVTPGKEGADKQLAKFEGKYELKGKYFTYDKPGYHYKDLDVDGDLIHDMSEDMMNDQKSRDGIGVDLFPLTAEEQRKYDFRLVDTESYRGRSVFRVAFEPRRARNSDGGADWKGEALIDAEEYQPVRVETSLAEKVPLLVKTLLGTDIKGLGFSISYQRFGDGVWFPVSYGGEFEVRGLFFYKRKISVSMRNSDFRKTDVNSTLVYGTDAH